MNARASPRGGLTILGLVLLGATALFWLLNAGGGGEHGRRESARLADLILALPGAAFLAVGSVLARRRPDNRVGWLCLAIALLWMTVAASSNASRWALQHGMPRGAAWISVLGSLWVPALGLTGTHLPLRLPTGALLSARWRWYSRFCTAVILLTFVLIAVEPGRMAPDVPESENPLGSQLISSFSPLFVLLPLSFIGAIGSLVVRYRRAGGIERLQLRWIAFGGVLFLAAYVTIVALFLTFLSDTSAAGELLILVNLAAFSAIPISIGIAVLRYRLYDIDIIIRRTLVYATLTGALLLVYFGSVVLLQGLFRPLVGGDSELAIIVSTLGIAALFNPLRRRIQNGVDRRFYRRKYDAEQVLAAFGSRLRDEVDLQHLRDALLGVVEETVQPAFVSLWLRELPLRTEERGGNEYRE